MEHNFDLPSIQVYQTKIVGELNSQIGRLQSEQTTLTNKQKELTTKQTDLNSQLASLSSSSSSTSSEAAQKAQQISSIQSQLSSIATQLSAIASRLSALTSQIDSLTSAIEETNTFIDGLTTRINDTDMTYAEKLRQINEAIETYTNSMKNVTSILYPPIGDGTLLGNSINLVQGVRATNFMNILSNMTKTSYGYTMVKCVEKDIDIRIPDADIAKATKEALGIENIRDPDKLLAWAQTLGMISGADLTSAISNGYLSNIGIDSSSNWMYRGDVQNSYISSFNGGGLTPFQNDLADCLKQIYKLPHQHPLGDTTNITWDYNDPDYTVGDGFHRGIDFPCYSAPIYATTGGFVVGKNNGAGNMEISDSKDTETKYTSYAGNYVRIRDQAGNDHWYGHLSEATIAKDRLVLPGEKIGISGNSGYSQGGHLHYEVQPNEGYWFQGTAIDPKPFIPEGFEKY